MRCTRSGTGWSQVGTTRGRDCPFGGSGGVAEAYASSTTTSASTIQPPPPLTTDTWLLRSTTGGTSWTEERIGTTSFDMTTAPDALGYFVGDYAGLDFAGGGLRPGFKPFHVRANSGNLANRTDVFTTTASTGP